MEGRHRASSKSMKGLLGKQLADISDTLAKASARRDAEVKRRLTPQPKLSLAPNSSLRPPSTNSSLNSDAEATIGSESGRSVSFAGDYTQSAPRDLGQPDLNLPQTTTSMGSSHNKASVMIEQWTNEVTDEIIPMPSLRGGCVSNEDDPKVMLTQPEKSNITGNALNEDDDDDDDDIESMLLQLERLTATHIHAGTGHSGDTTSQMKEPAENPSPVISNGASDEDDDPTRLLAELASSSLLSRGVVHEMEDIYPEQLLAKMKSELPFADKTTTHDADDELTEMLANVEARAEVRHNSESMNTSATVEKIPSAIHQSHAGNEQEGIEALYNRLMGIQSFSPDLTPSVVERHSEKLSGSFSVPKPNKEIIPYTIALQLELAGTQWDMALGWTKYLFSTGLDSHQARRKKDMIVAQADKDLDKVVQQVLRDEEHYLGAEDRNKIPRRLIVSNLAAGASAEDLEVFFYAMRYMIQGIKVLPIQDPNKGTQVAHVDMLTRRDAVRASFTVGSIFGLIPTLELAEKRDN